MDLLRHLLPTASASGPSEDLPEDSRRTSGDLGGGALTSSGPVAAGVCRRAEEVREVLRLGDSGPPDRLFHYKVTEAQYVAPTPT